VRARIILESSIFAEFLWQPSEVSVFLLR
jgi:hypothetical protein